MTTYRDDPYGDFNFIVTIDGISDDGGSVRAGFSEVSGLGAEIEPIEYRVGGEDFTVRKIPGLKKFTNIVLKRGVTGDLAFWNWMRTALGGQVQRANGTITLLDEARNPVATWRFRRGWVCKYSGPALNAEANEVAIESFEICHEGLELE